MDKNTPQSSLPLPDHEMESKGKEMTQKKVEANPIEPSVQTIKNIQNYSKALVVKPTKSALQFVEYLTN